MTPDSTVQSLEPPPTAPDPSRFKVEPDMLPLPRSPWKRVLKWSLLSVGGLMLLAASAVILPNMWIVLSTSSRVYRDINKLPNNEVGLLLGTGKYADRGVLSKYYKHRVTTAAELYLAGKIKKILISGNNERGVREPRDMRADLLLRGVPDSALILDTYGLRTLDSVVRAKELFGFDKFTIISQEYHDYRAVFLARHHGIDAVAFCAPTRRNRLSPSEVREYKARILAFLDIFILGTRPQHEGLEPERAS